MQQQFFSRMLIVITLMVGITVTGCRKNYVDRKPANVLTQYTNLPEKTRQELQAVQYATVRYKYLENAITDGYTDINVVVENMGFHYMKASLADTVFDYRRPEILVYNKNHEGIVELVAVEYAVPIALHPVGAPEGFTGNADVWKRDTGFGLWLLHAWVWSYNANGVFNPTNPGIHLH